MNLPVIFLVVNARAETPKFVQFTVFLRIKQGNNSRDAYAIPVPGSERNSSPSGSQEETLKLGKEHMGTPGLYLKAPYKSKSIPKSKVYNQRFIYQKKKVIHR